MNSILNLSSSLDSQSTIIVLLSLATFRVYLEIIKFDFNKLPMTKAWGQRVGTQSVNKFHKMGLYFSLGYIVLFAPSLLF